MATFPNTQTFITIWPFLEIAKMENTDFVILSNSRIVINIGVLGIYQMYTEKLAKLSKLEFI